MNKDLSEAASAWGTRHGRENEMYITKKDCGWYEVCGKQIRGFDWRIKKGAGCYYAQYAGPEQWNGGDACLAIEPAQPEQQAAIKRASLLEIASWAYGEIVETIASGEETGVELADLSGD